MATLVKFGDQLINLDRVEAVRYDKKLNRLVFGFHQQVRAVQDVTPEMLNILAGFVPTGSGTMLQLA